MLKSILIANRGEIARRIIRTGKRLGIKTVSVFSEVDKNALHVIEADDAIFLDSRSDSYGYLDINAILRAANQSKVQAIHPGYGFLSESPRFAESVIKAGLIFVGPSFKTIQLMSIKSEAKKLIEKLGIPVIPGYSAGRQDITSLKQAAKKLGYPILIKAVAGGGGRGIRFVDCEENFVDQINDAKHEGGSIFGDKKVLLEKFLINARHIEVQIFGDSEGNVIHLYDRDCSIQRNYQKVIEECPAPNVSEEKIKTLCDCAVKIGEAINYVGAGTIEFLLLEDGSYFFMEMNTRLQVEHPVTEAVTGLDLVEWQLKIAAGQQIPLSQNQIRIDGHSIEARLYAESPNQKFLPQSGILTNFSFLQNQEIRLETGVRSGDEVTHYYDPMIAKLISHGPTRNIAIAKLRKALSSLFVTGVETNQNFLKFILKQKVHEECEYSISWLDKVIVKQNKYEIKPSIDDFICAYFFLILQRTEKNSLENQATVDSFSPWFREDGWRISGSIWETLFLYEQTAKLSLKIQVKQEKDVWLFLIGRTRYCVVGNINGYNLKVEINKRLISCAVICNGESINLKRNGQDFKFQISKPVIEKEDNELVEKYLLAPIPSVVTQIFVKPNHFVKKGTRLLVLEAMKMEHVTIAPADCRVVSVLCKIGANVAEGSKLVLLDYENLALGE